MNLSKLGIRSRLRAAFFMPALCVAALAAFLSIYPPSNGHADFADQSTAAGTSTGSANAYAITINNYSKHLALVPLRFIPNFTNTGPATINVSGLGNVAILRPSSIGLVALSGQEILNGEPTSVEYNGTNYVLSSNVDMTPIGRTVEYRGSAVPRGTLIEDGSCVSQTTYAALFSVISTNYGSCSAGLFALPDSRGTMFAALDNQGVNGAANRITSAGSGCTATAIGLCGSQSQTLTAAQIPSITSTTTVNTAAGGLIPTLASTGTIGGVPTVSSGSLSAPYNSNLNGAAWTASTSFSGTSTSSNTSGAAHPILPPALLGRRAIKF